MANIYEEVSRNDLDVQKEFADISKLIGVVLANWCTNIPRDEGFMFRYGYLNCLDTNQF